MLSLAVPRKALCLLSALSLLLFGNQLNSPSLLQAVNASHNYNAQNPQEKRLHSSVEGKAKGPRVFPKRRRHSEDSEDLRRQPSRAFSTLNLRDVANDPSESLGAPMRSHPGSLSNLLLPQSPLSSNSSLPSPQTLSLPSTSTGRGYALPPEAEAKVKQSGETSQNTVSETLASPEATTQIIDTFLQKFRELRRQQAEEALRSGQPQATWSSTTSATSSGSAGNGKGNVTHSHFRNLLTG